MTDKLSSLPDDRFIALWNAADTLDEAAANIRAKVGTPCPRWAMMARASALRGAGVAMKRLALNPGPTTGGPS